MKISYELSKLEMKRVDALHELFNKSKLYSTGSSIFENDERQSAPKPKKERRKMKKKPESKFDIEFFVKICVFCGFHVRKCHSTNVCST